MHRGSANTRQKYASALAEQYSMCNMRADLGFPSLNSSCCKALWSSGAESVSSRLAM